MTRTIESGELVAVRGNGPGIGEFKRRVRKILGTDPLAVPADLPLVFDAEGDRWTVNNPAGAPFEAGIVVDATEATDRHGLLDINDARERFGAHAYLGVARHGFPNYFVAADRDAGRYAARCVAALIGRHSTRIEIRGHAQAQACRRIELRHERLNPSVGKRPILDDFEFTHHDEREEDDDYRGPALIVDGTGATFDVKIHILAVFQPIDNAIRWSGRVLPAPGLESLHRAVNQPITISIGSRPPVPALLVDRDPWGGSHILGSGGSPYQLPLATEIA
ncbi:DUF4873 domain-containing protein [Gordonia polyisoprenivorans]|uniref:DUF4873 domain-containing protein n=1 Tax=Gordonia polyisoprenivorans TaxID=84595 RepID=UPI002301AE25|nr:DUF4873 domain-containing protein [Gordonia polyisoprenivorans]WCB35348.1 DUF4873 domain-containing protein [Gordonia polyisoprenivorans]